MNAPAFTRDDRAMHFGPQMPDAIEAEQALLGALLLRSEGFDAIPVGFDASHFEEPLHGRLFAEMAQSRKEGRRYSTISLKQAIGDLKIGDISLPTYMARLMSDVPALVHVPDYCSAITGAYARRQVQSLASHLQQAVFRDDMQFMTELEDIRRHLAEVRSSMQIEASGFSLADALNRSLEAIDDAFHKRGPMGLKPGVEAVEDLIGTIDASDLIIIGAGSKQGKTALAMQMMFEMARAVPVFCYSGEMTERELVQRELARRTGISARRQKRGQVKDAEMDRLVQASAAMQHLQHVEIECRKLTLDKIAQRARALKKSKGIGLIVIDHLAKIHWEGRMAGEDEWRRGDMATSFLKDLAMEIGVPVIALTHLKKTAFQEYSGNRLADRLRSAMNRRPTYRDLVGNMDRDANHVIIPFQPRPIIAGMEPAEGSDDHAVWEEYMAQTEGKAEIILSLSRSADFPRRKEVAWHGETTSYGDRYDRPETPGELF